MPGSIRMSSPGTGWRGPVLSEDLQAVRCLEHMEQGQWAALRPMHRCQGAGAAGLHDPLSTMDSPRKEPRQTLEGRETG